jgi:hypothetical protein
VARAILRRPTGLLERASYTRPREMTSALHPLTKTRKVKARRSCKAIIRRSTRSAPRKLFVVKMPFAVGPSGTSIAPQAATAEIREGYLEAESYAESYIDYALWPTACRGRLTAAQVASEIAPVEDYAVMLCARQFRALGVLRDRIITEEFEFR